MTVRQATATFVEHQRAKGLQLASVGNCDRGLRWFFDRKIRDREVRRITPRLVYGLLDRMGRRLSSSTGKTLSEATQRAHQAMARAFFVFCVERGWLDENPLDGLPETARSAVGGSR